MNEKPLPKCTRTNCFANCNGGCDCLSKTFYPNDEECSFFKDRKTFKRYVDGFYRGSQKKHE